MAKNKAGKSTKKIAGVKVPKDLRTKLQPVIKAAEHPIVADLIAAGIAAASAAIANSKTVRAAAAKAGDEAEDAAYAAAAGAKRGSNVAKAIAIDFARHFIDAYEGKPSGGKTKKAKSGGKRSSAGRSR